MKAITVVADDKVGLLAEISYVLAKQSINIEALDFDVVGKKAVVVLTVADSQNAKKALSTSGYEVAEENCVMVRLTDKPGEFNRLASMLAHEGINIEKVHMVSREGKRTILSLVVNEPETASRILSDYLTSSESRY
jgi:hypothetical protein